MHASPVFHGEKPWIFARLFRPGAGVEVPPVKRSPAYEITMSWWNNLKLLKSEFSKQWQTYLYVHGIHIYIYYVHKWSCHKCIYIYYVHKCVYNIYIYIMYIYNHIYIICDILKCWENPVHPLMSHHVPAGIWIFVYFNFQTHPHIWIAYGKHSDRDSATW